MNSEVFTESLALKAEALPEPRNHFRGVATGFRELPQNLLIFLRTRSSDLDKEHYFHYRFVLIVNLRRSGTVVLEHRRFELSPGEALLVFPHQFHHYLWPTAGDLHWLFLNFELQRPEAVTPLRDIVRTMSAAGYAYLDRLLDLFLEYTRGNRENAGPSLGLLSALILQELQPRESGAFALPATLLPAAVEKVRRHIWDNLDKDLSIQSLANQVHHSASHLRLMFRKHMGMGLGAYVHKVRMDRARYFLLGTDKNVSQVAADCGYDSLYSFSRAFKAGSRLSPLAYRKLNGAG